MAFLTRRLSAPSFLACAASMFALSITTSASGQTVKQIPHGMVVTPAKGEAKTVRVLSYGNGNFRVTQDDGDLSDVPASLMVTAQPAGDCKMAATRSVATLDCGIARASVALRDGAVTITGADGKPLLTEHAAARRLTPVTIEGQPFLTTRAQFNRSTDEGLYGLGQHQNRQMNYNGEDVELAQHNMAIALPYLLSTKGYGILWDNNSITRVGNPDPYRHVGESLKVSHAGKPGWRAEYFLGDRSVLTRHEAKIDYQYLRDVARWPEEAKARTVAATGGQNTLGNSVETQRVIWTGTVAPTSTGRHKFRLYSSSYVRVFADGKEVLNRWRQNWNPWYHNFDLDMTKGKPVDLRIEWEPNQGYMALFHSDPLPAPDRNSVSFASDVGKAIDYYVVTGSNMDSLVAGYRHLTGAASMMPKWAYGFWQSRQRYQTQDQLLDVMREYRKRAIPIDNIVQDWFYWPEDAWGSHDFDPARFPDPKKMVEEVHALNGRIMISVWPKFYPTTEHGKALDAQGWLYRRPLEAKQRDWVGPGYFNTFYDPYQKGARDLYFAQFRDKLLKLGFDAWWLDATEPDWHSNLSVEERAYQMGPTPFGPGAAVFNSYPIVHADGVAENLRLAQPDRRPFILTRSGFGGIQRASSALWSGDIVARWDDLRDQISAGMNISMAGVPNWTHDIGGFAVEDRYTKEMPEHLPEWRELNLRWFQFGAFSPLFRSHGEFPLRETYEIAKGDQAMYDAMVSLTQLRYRLMPYIYTLGADSHFNHGTIMRGLVMDFPQDKAGWGIDDQYMFGPAFMVAPVTAFGARSRSVHLPAGADWYDFHTGAFLKGGQSIVAQASRETLPLFVRAGSIIPTGPAIQHTAEQPDGEIVLHVYTGANGNFSVYEDDGVSMDYAKGAFARIPIRWDETTATLTIGARSGAFPGMPTKRAMSVRVYRPGAATAPDFAENPAISFVYDGTEKTLVLK